MSGTSDKGYTSMRCTSILLYRILFLFHCTPLTLDNIFGGRVSIARIAIFCIALNAMQHVLQHTAFLAMQRNIVKKIS